MYLNPLVVEAFADELVKTADLSPEVLGLLLGGAGGVGLGYGMTDDPRKKTRNALLGGLAGAAGGTMLGGELGKPELSDMEKALKGQALVDEAQANSARLFQKYREMGHGK